MEKVIQIFTNILHAVLHAANNIERQLAYPHHPRNPTKVFPKKMMKFVHSANFIAQKLTVSIWGLVNCPRNCVATTVLNEVGGGHSEVNKVSNTR